MSDLISKATARDLINTWGRIENENVRMQLLYSDLNAIPAIDAVPIVRCYGCKHYYDEKGSCDLHDERGPDGEIEHRFYVTADWFCADGEIEND